MLRVVMAPGGLQLMDIMVIFQFLIVGGADIGIRQRQSVVVEGGATILQIFIDAGLWDEAKVFASDKGFGKGVQSPRLHGNLIAQESVFNDTLRTYHPLHGKSQHS